MAALGADDLLAFSRQRGAGLGRTDTEVYLRITTALLQEANTRFHAFAEALLPAAGDQS